MYCQDLVLKFDIKVCRLIYRGVFLGVKAAFLFLFFFLSPYFVYQLPVILLRVKVFDCFMSDYYRYQ